MGNFSGERKACTSEKQPPKTIEKNPTKKGTDRIHSKIR